VLCVTICFYEIWFNIIMVFEPAYDIESHFLMRLSIQYAETCMWRLVINKWHFALFLGSLYKYVNVLACKSFKLLPGEDRSVFIVQGTLYCAIVLIFFCDPHRIIVLCRFVSPYFGLGVYLYLWRQIRNVAYIGVSLGSGDVSRLLWISLLDVSLS